MSISPLLSSANSTPPLRTSPRWTLFSKPSLCNYFRVVLSEQCPPGPVTASSPRRQISPAPPAWAPQGGFRRTPAPAPPLISQLRPPEARGGGRGGEDAPTDATGARGTRQSGPSSPGRRSPTFSKFNRYLNPKGNEQTSGIGCQGIFSFVGRIYPQVFP